LHLADASIDFAVSHMAMMLMDDVDDVVSELARVLRPGGTFAVMIGSKSISEGAMSLFATTFDEVYREHRGAAPPPMGDPRAGSGAAMRALLERSGFFEVAHVEEVDLVLDAPRDEVWDALSLMYKVALLDAHGKLALRSAFLERAHALVRADGLVPFRFPAHHVIARRTP
jgi:SAM-dependent methyltransferase